MPEHLIDMTPAPRTRRAYRRHIFACCRIGTCRHVWPVVKLPAEPAAIAAAVAGIECPRCYETRPNVATEAEIAAALLSPARKVAHG